MIAFFTTLLQCLFGFFSRKEQLSNEVFRAILLDAYGVEISEGEVKLELDYILISHKCKDYYRFHETIVDNVNIPRSVEFFEFLKTSNIAFENYDELVGMVFDTRVDYDIIDGKKTPILIKKSLVAKPKN